MSRTLIAAALGVAATVGASAAVAWAASPAEAISARQANFKQMGRAQKAITDELKKSAPDVATIRKNAEVLAILAPGVDRWFPRGTGKEAGAKTAALPAIWQETAQFNRSAAAFDTAAGTLKQAAASGSIDRIRAAVSAVGRTCKGCHDTFKGDK